MTHETQNPFTEELDQTTEAELEELIAGGEPTEEELDDKEAETALAVLEPTLKAIPFAEVRSFKVKTTSAVGLGLAYAEAFAEDRDAFAESFDPSAFDPAEHDDLADRARAFWRADIRTRQELNAAAPFRLLVLEAKPLRSKMMKAAQYLWGDDPELGDVVANIRKGHGYANKADDLGSLAALFTAHWERAEGKCEVTLDDIARAEVLGADILQAMSSSRSEVLDNIRTLRQRAAEHLRRGMEEVRSAAKYVFRNDSAKMKRYPSLFIRRRKKTTNGKQSAADSTTSTVETPTTEQLLSEQYLQDPSLLNGQADAIAEEA
jgi:hypothetical protein